MTMSDHRTLRRETIRLLTTLLSGEPRENAVLRDDAFRHLPNDPGKHLRTDGPPRTLAAEWTDALWDATCMDGRHPLTRLLRTGCRTRRQPKVDIPGGYPALLAALDASCAPAPPAPDPDIATGATPTTAPQLTRPADQDVRRLAACEGLTLVIKGPEETGKSRLLTDFLSHCVRQGKTPAYIDFRNFGNADLDHYPRFLSQLAWMLQDALGQTTDEPPAIASQYAMSRFMETKLLQRLQNALVIGFDEVDRILGRPYQEDFFSLLRSWHNKRNPLQPQWQRLDLALVISTEPYLLIADDARSPFNVGEIIELGAFTLAEYQALNQAYGNPLAPAEVERLWRLLGGQPPLTHSAFARLTGPDRIDLRQLLDTAADPQGPFKSHLRKLADKLRKAPELHQALAALVHQGSQPERALCDRLHGAGLVRWEQGRVHPASQLHAAYIAAAGRP